MVRIFGYGEDALTLWALENHLPIILNRYKDQTDPKKCLVFYRPSFGRRGGKNSSEFGEFDSIVASTENIYLIESKWDSFGRTSNCDRILKDIVKSEQELRHQVFSWYLTEWNQKHLGIWEKFRIDNEHDLLEKFGKKIPKKSTTSLLQSNLELILERLLSHCKNFLGEDSIKNVLLFFHKGTNLQLPDKVDIFELVKIDYGRNLEENFIALV